MKRYIYLSVLLIALLSLSAYGQDLEISGKVLSAENQQPIEGVTIRISGIRNNQVSEKNGEFSFENLSAGSYPTSFSYLGYEAQRINLVLPSAGSRNLSVRLAPTSNQLQAVEIIGRKEQSYKNTASFAGTKTETPIKYVPQAI